MGLSFSPRGSGWLTAPLLCRGLRGSAIKMIVKGFGSHEAASQQRRLCPTEGVQFPQGPAGTSPPREEGPFCSLVISLNARPRDGCRPGPVPAAGSRPHTAQRKLCVRAWMCAAGVRGRFSSDHGRRGTEGPVDTRTCSLSVRTVAPPTSTRRMAAATKRFRRTEPVAVASAHQPQVHTVIPPRQRPPLRPVMCRMRGPTAGSALILGGTCE